MKLNKNSTPLFDKYIFLTNDKNWSDIVKVIENIWKNEELVIGWLVNFHSKISNSIKFFTQSIFSHVNFVLFKKDNNWKFKLLTVWSEDSKWIVSLQYHKKQKGLDHFYFILKQIDIDLITFLFDFSIAEAIVSKVYKSKIINYFSYKFSKYCNFRIKMSKDLKLARNIEEMTENQINDFLLDKISLKSVIQENISYYNQKEDLAELVKQINKFIEIKSSLKASKWNISFNTNDKKIYTVYFQLLKEFILYWVIEHIISKAGSAYDIKWTLSVWGSSWKKTWMKEDVEFCSEFVADCLFFAWIYPFDINSKSPESISPWDIMDMRLFYKAQETKLLNIEKWNIKIILDSKSNWFDSFKDVIINREWSKFYFIRQRIVVFIVEMLISVVLNFWKIVIFGFFIYFLLKFLN